jgi:hypothetical protein
MAALQTIKIPVNVIDVGTSETPAVFTEQVRQGIEQAPTARLSFGPSPMLPAMATSTTQSLKRAWDPGKTSRMRLNPENLHLVAVTCSPKVEHRRIWHASK